LEFASLLVYAPRGASDISRRSREITRALKENAQLQHPTWGPLPCARYFALRLGEELGRSPFPQWFDDAILVPVPRSSPQRSQHDLWPARELALAMAAQGHGSATHTLLRRTHPVPKSAFCAPGERPGADAHRDSFVVTPALLLDTRRIVLIDDVVTRGATLIGAAWCIAQTHPHVQVVGFAAVRTISDGDVPALLDPCRGTITASGQRLRRHP